ncbi:phage tail protein [Zoogloea sp.]|uniref:phage tail protein n=1 Tax=Zoogloea sp. TaxID=49181 RepID=UPI0035AEB6D5
MARKDPLRNMRFRLEIDGIQQAGFSEVAIGEVSTDAVDYREGNEANHVRKLSGLNKFGNITLKWGVTDSQELFNWHKQVVAGQLQQSRKQVAIIVVDESGADKARFVVSEAWPIKYDPSDLNAKGNEVFIEVLELANEGIERI